MIVFGQFVPPQFPQNSCLLRQKPLCWGDMWQKTTGSGGEMKLNFYPLTILSSFSWEIFSRRLWSTCAFYSLLLFSLSKENMWIHTLGHTQESLSEPGISPRTSVSNLKHSWLLVQLFSWMTVQRVDLCSISSDVTPAGGESCFISGSETQKRMSEKCHFVSNHGAETFFFLPRCAYNDAL